LDLDLAFDLMAKSKQRRSEPMSQAERMRIYRATTLKGLAPVELRLTPAIRDKLRALAKSRGMSNSEFIESLIESLS
jgi:hypothetical protein